MPTPPLAISATPPSMNQAGPRRRAARRILARPPPLLRAKSRPCREPTSRPPRGGRTDIAPLPPIEDGDAFPALLLRRSPRVRERGSHSAPLCTVSHHGLP